MQCEYGIFMRFNSLDLPLQQGLDLFAVGDDAVMDDNKRVLLV